MISGLIWLVLTAKVKWNETLGGYNQWLYIKGKLVSELHIKTGKAKSFYIDTECQSKHKGTVSAHSMICHFLNLGAMRLM